MLSGRALRRAHQTAPAVADVPERTGFVKQQGVRLCDRLSRLPTATAGVMHRALHVTAPPPPQIFGDVYDVYGRSRRRPCYRPLHVMPPTVVLHSSVDNWGCARPFLEHFPEHGCSDGAHSQGVAAAAGMRDVTEEAARPVSSAEIWACYL